MDPCPYGDVCERGGTLKCRDMVMRTMLPDGPHGRTIEAEMVDMWWSSKGNVDQDTRRCWQNRES